jgi:hypothetical protein
MMEYEKLRSMYKVHLCSLVRLRELEDKAKSGKLSPERLRDCNYTITSLISKTDSEIEFFTRLEMANDPAWRKMSRELDTTLEEYSDPNHKPLSIIQMGSKFIKTLSLLIVGTWMIDSWRRK